MGEAELTNEMKKKDSVGIEKGSGYRALKTRRLAKVKAGDILGAEQPHVSNLIRGQSGNLSVGRLMEFLTALGQDVEITVRPTRKTRRDVLPLA
jgi:predicted XRE-type DNA-binding protein